MRLAHRVTCGTLALLMTGLPCWVLLEMAGHPALGRTIDADGVPGIMVSLVPVAVPLTSLDAAQPPALNSARLTDQNNRSVDATLPAASVLAPGSDAVDDHAYLPVAQLTEWPRQRARIEPDAGDDDVPDDVSIPDVWRSPTVVEAVLMIDEQGEVNHVQLYGDALALPVRQGLDRRLRAMRFVPGRLFGRPVRSRLTVELTLH